MLWRRAGKPADKYSKADVVYGASKDILERALKWQVDGVLIVSAMFLHPDLLLLLQRAHIPAAVVLTESPYDDAMQARILPAVDLAWTNDRGSVRMLRQANPYVEYLPHAFDPTVHYPPDWCPHGDHWADDCPDLTGAPAHDVVFVGSLFDERRELLDAVDWSGIDVALYGQWQGLGSRAKLRRFVRGDVIDNRNAAGLYRRAKIGLNLYRESVGWGKGAPRVSGAESVNPRALELAACRCFQISQPRSEAVELFGDNVGTFTTPQELEATIRYYLAHDAEREQKAHAALIAAQPRTFAAMARQVLHDLARAGWPVEQMAVAS